MPTSAIPKRTHPYENQVTVGHLPSWLLRIHGVSVAALLTIGSLVCGGLLLSGCAQQSSTPFFTPRGVIPMNAPPTTPAPVLQYPAGPFDGVYRGTSRVLSGAGRCFGTQRVEGFHVRGNVARWQGYRGTIDPGGGVQMHFGQEWIVGQFRGNIFMGQLEIGGWSRNDSSCVYGLALERVGP